MDTLSLHPADDDPIYRNAPYQETHMYPSTTATLNPTLVQALIREFGHVRVTHPGEAMESRMDAGVGVGRTRLHIARYGETYRVCCPCCDDRSFSLCFKHRYGTVSEETGRPLDWLIKCFAYGCTADPAVRTALFRRLDQGRGLLAGARVRPGTAPANAPPKLPQPFIRLDRLPANHPTRTELGRLHLKPDLMGKGHGVGWCGPTAEGLARARIVAPVKTGDSLAGWLAVQAAADGLQFRVAPGMQIGRVCYNLHRARTYPVGVVVPTVEWVWRLGLVATTPLSWADPRRSANGLVAEFRRKPIVLVTCSETDARLEAAAAQFRSRLDHRFAVVRLPPVARAVDRKALRRLVSDQAEAAGIAVAYAVPD